MSSVIYSEKNKTLEVIITNVSRLSPSRDRAINAKPHPLILKNIANEIYKIKDHSCYFCNITDEKDHLALIFPIPVNFYLNDNV